MAIKELATEALDRVLEIRPEKGFTSMADFLHRITPDEESTRALIHAGALDCLMAGKVNRATLLWEYLSFKRVAKKSGDDQLFAPSVPTPPSLSPLPMITQLRMEYRTLGFLCSRHPITFYNKETKGMIKARQLRKWRKKRIRIAGWLITGKIVSTVTGEAMEFLTFEDETDLFETTFFPKVFARYGHLLLQHTPYVLEGVVEEDFGAITITVEHVTELHHRSEK